MELNKVVEFFDQRVRESARPSEITSFDSLARTAQRDIDRNGPDFEAHLVELRGRNYTILWRQDWFVIDRFKWLSQGTHMFPDADAHARLVGIGDAALKAGDMTALRNAVSELESLRIGPEAEDGMLANANIVRS